MNTKTIRKIGLLIVPLFIFVSLFAFTGVSKAFYYGHGYGWNRPYYNNYYWGGYGYPYRYYYSYPGYNYYYPYNWYRYW